MLTFSKLSHIIILSLWTTLHFLSDDIVESFDSSKNDPSLQAQIIRDSNKIEGLEENYNNHFERNGDER